MRTEQNRVPAAIVIARKIWRSGSRRKAIRFYKRFAPAEATSRSQLGLGTAGRSPRRTGDRRFLFASLPLGHSDSDFVIVRSRNSKTTMLLDYDHEQEYEHEF